MRLKQLVIRKPDKEPPDNNTDDVRTIPIEDIGVVILDHRQITVTQSLLEELLENNCAIITCSSNHLPAGLMLPLYGHTLQNERFRLQINASLPLKKQLWQQTVQSKISNQASVLKYATGEEHNNMKVWAADVKSGDTGNMEARAAAYYWKTIFPENKDFIRDRYEGEPNNLLNYGYAILRAIVARALVSSGLLPTLGIHHHNRYNAYCLADDIMEPFRPFVDEMVFSACDFFSVSELGKAQKSQLLQLLTADVISGAERRPLLNSISYTSASLVRCFLREETVIKYPEFVKK